MTLPVGGNDLFFGEYVIKCLVGLGNCNEVLVKIFTKPYDLDNQYSLLDDLKNVWGAVGYH